ncbi:SUR7/PalI family protein, partial [Aspergillus saccharolyticus JOP 1030-1]
MAKLPPFNKATQRPQAGRTRSKVLWHRITRSLCYLIAWIFLLLVCIGNVADKPVIRETYFLKIDLANIIPLSVPNAVLINTIARTIGLHDFYQVGLWNFCEGYLDEGITHCSKTKTLYWFNPVEIILNELLSGATIALPSDITSALKIARIASHWMFGLFLTATVLSFILIFLSPLAVSSRPPQTISADPAVNQTHPQHRRRTFVFLRAFPFLLLTFLAALFTIVASVVATVMFIIFRNVFTSSSYDLNIGASLGTRMLAFMWIASGFNLIAFILQLGSCCASCCGGRKARKQLKR